MQKWEYKVLAYSITAQDVELFQLDGKTLDHLGHDGWELVSCISSTIKSKNSESVLMFFKRIVKTTMSKRNIKDEDDLPDLKTEMNVEIKLDGTITRYFLIKEDGSKEEVDKEQHNRYVQMYAKRHPGELAKVNVSINGEDYAVNVD